MTQPFAGRVKKRDPQDINIPPPRAHPNGTRLATAAMVRAANLICTVRDEGADSIGVILDKCDRQALYALTVVLAAMVPDDQSSSELLAWLEPRLEAVA